MTFRVMQHPISARSTHAGEPIPPTVQRAARAGRRPLQLSRQAIAGASLLVTSSMVLVPSLPAAAAEARADVAAASLDTQALSQPQAQAQAQALEPVAVEQSVDLPRDDILVRDAPPAAAVPAVPAETGALLPPRLAELQAVADSEPAGSSFGGDPAFPSAWSMLETSHTQTPFPDVAQLPISSDFGFRAGGFHGGTDIALDPGHDIRPIAEGVVSEVWQGNNPGGGYSVFIDHNIDGQFVQSWYAHMLPGSIQVEVGQVVDTTTVIGDLGNSGVSTGPHLHLELKNSDYVSFDPMLWLQTGQMRLEGGR